jgi:hypothetical protein
MSIALKDFGLEDRKLLKQFARFPWKHYSLKEKVHTAAERRTARQQAAWASRACSQKTIPITNMRAFRHWLAYENGEVVGRISASVKRGL